MTYRRCIPWLLFGVGIVNSSISLWAASHSSIQKKCDHRCRLEAFRSINNAGHHQLVFSQAARYAELEKNSGAQADWRLIQMEARLKEGRTNEGRAVAAQYASKLPLSFALQARGLLYYDHLVNYRYGRAESELEKLAKNSDVIYDRALLYRLTGRNTSFRQLENVRPETKAFAPPPERPGLFWFFTSSIFPGGGHLYQGNTRLFLLSFFTVGGLAGLGTFFAVDGQLVPAVLSGYFALVFYQVSIVYGYRNLMEDYGRTYRNWENRLILRSKYRF